MPQTTAATDPDWNVALTAALDWWRDAGVDGPFVDEPQDWLAAVATTAPPPPAPLAPLNDKSAERAPPVVATVGARSQWPQSLDGFAEWWLTEPTLASARLRRIAPAGPREARLMVLVPMPEADDGDALLTGRAGRLLDAMLPAMGIDRAQTYLASALPAHIPMPDWANLRTAGLGEVLLHHIALAAPRKLLILGGSTISTLLGHDPPNLAHSLRAINQETSGIDAMPTWDLDAMLVRPALKAGFWSRWLEWTGKQE